MSDSERVFFSPKLLVLLVTKVQGKKNTFISFFIFPRFFSKNPYATHMKRGFDHQRYIAEQSAAIMKRIQQCGDRLYLEFGGKLFDDYHASRILP